jgi:hypothetical protein
MQFIFLIITLKLSTVHKVHLRLFPSIFKSMYPPELCSDLNARWLIN